MLAIAKERAVSLGLQEIIEFKESDAENLDLPNSSFDAVLCRWGLMLLPNFDSVLHDIHTWLLPGDKHRNYRPRFIRIRMITPVARFSMTRAN